MERVEEIVNKNLCISCGICAANCPEKCIQFERDVNRYIPRIASNCIQCGMCMNVCPGFDIGDFRIGENFQNDILGNYKGIYCASAKSDEILQHSISGGVITQTVLQLLRTRCYESAFLVSGYSYEHRLETKRFCKTDDLSSTPNSRYLTVSHEKAVRYMIEHPNEKIIFVATSCAVRGIIKTIHFKNLDRSNYLIIGLFCDKTMNYGVIKYFKSLAGGGLTALYFRTKEAGGWPGNMRLCYADGSHKDLPNSERIKVKEYFQPERCLYCLDKLNSECDISVGDNYIAERADKKGIGSVIVRTDIGERAWEVCKDLFNVQEDSAEALIKSQHLEAKVKNYNFACLKGLRENSHNNRHNSKSQLRDYQIALTKIKIGSHKHPYRKVQIDIKIRRIKKSFKKIFSIFRRRKKDVFSK